MSRTPKLSPEIVPTAPLSEEILNGITHGIGVVLSIAGLIWLVVKAAGQGTPLQIASFSVYGACLILVFLASTLYHSIQHKRLKEFFVRMDHSAIYLMIAGSYTPFMLLAVGGLFGWLLLGVVWALALVGVGYKTFFYRHGRPLLWLYLLMGWLSLVAIYPMQANLPLAALLWVLAGGVAYTIGVIFFSIKRIPYMHVVWHLFVLAGSVCHYVAILGYLAPHG